MFLVDVIKLPMYRLTMRSPDSFTPLLTVVGAVGIAVHLSVTTEFSWTSLTSAYRVACKMMEAKGHLIYLQGIGPCHPIPSFNP